MRKRILSWDSRYEAVETVQQSTVKYMEELEAELSSMPGYKKPEHVKREKESLKSRIPDTDIYRCIKQRIAQIAGTTFFHSSIG